MNSTPNRSLRVANVSGFYGDRLSAMREQLAPTDPTAVPVDVITGDWLAELTMLILGKDTLKDPDLGYAKTFLTQLRECLDLALERGVRIVSNAGGLNPAGLAAAIEALGTRATVAYIDGDDLRSSGLFPGALTANAYLGAFGIAEALAAGADVVVTGRVTDASVVVGPAIWHHSWTREHLDELAGAVIAGHVIECGTQATGGNFSGLLDALHTDRLGDPTVPFGFPIAEIAADGSCVITKHPGTGGLVTVDTVAAQLFYEIQGPVYLNPDVSTDLRTVEVRELGRDRVEISGVRGDLPPAQLKVAVNELGGWRNQIEFVLTGLDIEEKAELLKTQVAAVLPPGLRHSWSPYRVPASDSATEEGAATLLRLTAWSSEAEEVGRAFTAPAIELVLASVAGFHVTAPPGRPSAYGVYRPAYVDREHAVETVHLPDGSTHPAHPAQLFAETPASGPERSPSAPVDRPTFSLLVEDGEEPGNTSAGSPQPERTMSPARRVALGQAVYARSGDKGGNANIGLWIPEGRPEIGVAWLLATVTPDWVRRLLPETAHLPIEVVPLPNLRGVNIIIEGILGAGVAEGVRFDPQAKALGEWIRSRTVEIPAEVLG